jgi:hypothetical protein
MAISGYIHYSWLAIWRGVVIWLAYQWLTLFLAKSRWYQPGLLWLYGLL